MEKLNIAEILKDCPKGMELDCTICDNVCLDEVTPNMIKCFVKNDVYNTIYFHHDGTYLTAQNAKCVIFPKGKTTWQGFQRPFKDGDIISNYRVHSICIFKKEGSIKGTIDYYCGISFGGLYVKDKKNIDEHFGDISNYRLATEEEKQKLFDAIKANGYKWNAETKTLEKLIVPKFKVGDRIKHKLTGYIYKVLFVISNGCSGGVYDVAITNEIGKSIDIEEQDSYELAPNKFDITALKAFESRVLVRSSMDGLWKPAVFGFRNGYNDNAFYIVGGSCWKQCIPYLNNEHLCGTTNDCDDFYKTWE